MQIVFPRGLSDLLPNLFCTSPRQRTSVIIVSIIRSQVNGIVFWCRQTYNIDNFFFFYMSQKGKRTFITAYESNVLDCLQVLFKRWCLTINLISF